MISLWGKIYHSQGIQIAEAESGPNLKGVKEHQEKLNMAIHLLKQGFKVEYANSNYVVINGICFNGITLELLNDKINTIKINDFTIEFEKDDEDDNI